MSLGTFEMVWEAYKETPPHDMIETTLMIDGKVMLLNHALQLCWNSTDALPEPLRKEVVAELNTHRPGMISMGGSKEVDPRYWKERIWNVSHAARALRDLFVRKMTLPMRYTPHG